MKIKQYAPVIIPTLNRFEHFKRCLDSLERCTGAEYTDVYVGLDYPPSEKYVEGWQKIDAYLKEKEEKNGFRNLFVRRRDHNCGVGKAGSNGSLLYREIKEVSDRYISTEDDNEFSPCFLEYMNKALEKYKDDERVVCVCGYTPFDVDGKENVFFSRQMYAWGNGRWIAKSERIWKFRNLESMEIALKSLRSAIRLYRFRPIMLSRVIDMVTQRYMFGDVSYTAYCVLHNRYCVFPSKTLVKNWGKDGTGVHYKKVADSSWIYQEISQNHTFEIDEIEVKEHKCISKLMLCVNSKKWYGNIAIFFRYLVWRITGKDIFSIRKL